MNVESPRGATFMLRFRMRFRRHDKKYIYRICEKQAVYGFFKPAFLNLAKKKA